MYNLQGAVNRSGLETSIQEFVKLRASQINGCAYCVDMHFKDAKAHGESDETAEPRLRLARVATLQRPRTGRAAVDRDAHPHRRPGRAGRCLRRVRQHFSEEELVNLTLAVVTINAWNRIAISFRPEVGPYQPPANVKRKEAAEQTA